MASMISKAKDMIGQEDGSDIKVADEAIHHTGYGLMGFTWRPNPPSQEQAFEAMSMYSGFWLSMKLMGIQGLH